MTIRINPPYSTMAMKSRDSPAKTVERTTMISLSSELERNAYLRDSAVGLLIA